uniref:Probable oligoribonuclease n=1 Tax=Rhipicephalus appendiculatus TaxID=34631 RepID=A0A131YQ81_RHIAP
MIVRQLLSLNFRSIKRVLSCVRPATTSMERGEGSKTLCSDGLVWIDLELTGLDLEKDRILEVACVVTDKDLNAISGGLNLVLHQPDDILAKMGEWCKEQHGKSGLTEACRRSHLTVKEAQDQLCAYVGGLVTPGQCPLAGSTVYVDRRFLQRDMPRLDALLHYRIVDVSTIKELARRWFREEYYQALKLKTASHRAMPDILESIEELKFYRKKILVAKEPSSASKIEANVSS